MKRQVIIAIYNTLWNKEINMNNTQWIKHSDILGEYLTDCHYSMAKRYIPFFIAWYLND